MTDKALLVPLFAGLAILAVALVLPMDATAQLAIIIPLLVLLTYARVEADAKSAAADVFRVVVLVVGGFITLRYLSWRAGYTLYGSDLFSLVAVCLLFGAELYSACIHFLGGFINVSRIRRPLLSVDDLPPGTQLPTVDVMIPSYNEDPELLEVTLRAARQMRYPADRFTVYLLDDGGTDQHIAHSDPAIASAARQRRADLQALCARLGVTYLTRSCNERAKAGNLNHALGHSRGELIVVLDADHVPTVEFLDRTVPWFVRHDDVFLVQTPHFMVNPDPVDRNILQGFSRMPSENDMFYRDIQRGLDFWGASFFCGSAAMLRRKHLEEVGGLCGDTVTEDAETAFELHSRGYRSIYIDRPMVAGLAPETFTAFVTQRMRWAQGMVQILVLKRPFMSPGLTLPQRLGYLSSIMFWLFPFSRIIFLVAPLAYLILGMDIYNASIMQILAYTVPHVIAIYIIADMLYGRKRWPLISELYEVMQCLFSAVAIFKVLLNPRKPAFMVTPKGETLDEEAISPLAWPFYVLFVLTLVGFAFGAYRLAAYPLTREMTIVVLLWNTFNFVTLLGAIGALLERRQRRASPRMPVVEAAMIEGASAVPVPCEIKDLSATGARLKLAADATTGPEPGEELLLSAYSHALDRQITLPIRICSRSEQHGVELGVQFENMNPQQADEAVAFSYGDSARWVYFQERRSRPISFFQGLAMTLSLIWRPFFLHLQAMMPRRSAHSVSDRVRS
ncbi:cellulose synthase catalytic subunit [Ectothiorhodospira sp. PHS-1]|uniref:UDP-forming cellulose synthase catalytic subunit n=1 Tax=Ectothiorhodospira sp. PHS-1 TaxID=519989 RepID=UPI00024A83D6|nr:UDP-forming cellulose synthase catalytic subunit [Ectothiorhodospira sp. PHS-1]EHQ53353.1 cellulose synthase catalytic subunit [Ectothiorhodospira sp. PHS-1]